MVGVELKTDERGFSLVESTIVFVSIVLIATAAGLVANRQNGSQSGQLRPNVVRLGTQPSKQNGISATATLELSSLGIDITVPDAINDLTYAAPAGNGGYGISTETLTNDDANCVATGSTPPLGYFFKGTGTYSETNVPSRLVKQFGAFYIAWEAPQAPCSTSSSVSALANRFVQDLTQSFDTVEEAPPGS